MIYLRLGRNERHDLRSVSHFPIVIKGNNNSLMFMKKVIYHPIEYVQMFDDQLNKTQNFQYPHPPTILQFCNFVEVYQL